MTELVSPAVGPTSRSIFHLHPLLRCNLACAHCYSESSPQAQGFLTRDQALAAIRQAASWGYSSVSISGGEPLLYPWLGELLSCARHLGLTTGLVSNGLLINRPGAIEALRSADFVALSVDGMSANHNAMRGQPRAFAKVLTAMARLADAAIPFGISCGIGPGNVGEIDDIAAATCAAGAALLQLHPVEPSGRAAHDADRFVLADEAATSFYLLAHLVALEYAGRMVVRSDVVHREVAIAHPHMLYAHADDPRAWAKALPAQLVGVLVMDPHGNLMPVTYGFPAHLQIGNCLREGYERVWDRYVTQRYAQLRELGRSVYDDILAGRGPDVFNPSALLARQAHMKLVEAA